MGLGHAHDALGAQVIERFKLSDSQARQQRVGGGKYFRVAWVSAALALLLAIPAALGVRSSVTSAPIARQLPLKVALDDDYPPYVFRDEDGRLTGYLPEYWELWSRKTGVRVVLLATNWHIAQRLLDEGHAEVLDTVFRTPERERKWSFSPPYATIEVPIIVHKDIGGITDIRSLQGFVVGAKAGDAVISRLRDHGVTAIREYPSYDAVLNAASSGEVRVWSVDVPPAAYYLHKRQMADQFRVALILYTGQFHRAVVRGREDLLELLADGQRRLRPSEDQALRDRWFGKRIGPWVWPRAVVYILGGLAGTASVLGLFVWILRREVRRKTEELSSALESRTALAERLQEIFRAAPVALGIVRRRTFLQVNDKMVELTGYARDELIGRSARLLYPNDAEYERVGREKYEQIRRTGLGTIETVWRRKDGALRNILLSSCSSHPERPDAEVTFTAVDITDFRRVEQELRTSQEELAGLIANLPGMVYRTRLDAPWRVSYASEGALEVLGVPARDLTERESLLDLVHPDDRDQVDASRRQSLTERGWWDGQYRIQHASGELRWVWDRVRCVSESEATDQEVIGYMTDVTNVRSTTERMLQLERELLESQKRESLGLMAASIAHDFNNILTVALGHWTLAMDLLPAESRARSELAALEAAVRRAADITRQLLVFVGRARPQKAPVDLSKLVHETLQMLRVGISRKISLVVDVQGELPLIWADRTQVQQVILNLVLNGAEAVGEASGTVTVTLRAVDLTAEHLKRVRIRCDRQPGRYVLLEVRDTGCGMSPSQLERLFEPFFSTKQLGRGLGLASVFGVVRGHAGLLDVESAPGRGTAFRVYFPAEEVERPAEEIAWSQTGLPEVLSGRVLVVDDEDGVRTVTAHILGRMGLEVLQAASGMAAIELIRHESKGLRAVLLDLTMPEMDGIEAFRHISAVAPEVPVILCSGFDEQDMAERFGGLGFAAFLHKPFDVAALRRALHAAFRKAGSSVDTAKP